MRLPGLSISQRPGVAWGAIAWRLLAVLVIVTMLAHWVWVLFAPRSISVLSAVLPMSNPQADQLFGSALPASTSFAVNVMPDVRLVGVFAGSPGFAVLELDGKRQLGLATGHEIAAGVTLLEVAKDHVVIERGGVLQQIRLADRAVKNTELKHMALK